MDTAWLPHFWQYTQQLFPMPTMCQLFPLGSKGRDTASTQCKAGCPLDASPAQALQCCTPILDGTLLLHTSSTTPLLRGHLELRWTWWCPASLKTSQSSSWRPPLHTLRLGWRFPFMVKPDKPQLSWKASLLSLITESSQSFVAAHHSQGAFPRCFSSHPSLLPLFLGEHWSSVSSCQGYLQLLGQASGCSQ